MIKHQTVPYGLLFSVAPEQFSHLHLGDDSFGNDFGWDESENQYQSESLANNVLDFLREIAAK